MIGLVHGWLLWSFDVLRFYALWAILLPLFSRLAIRRLGLVAVSASVLIPALVTAFRVLHPAPEPLVDANAEALAAFTSGSYRDMLAANWRYDWYLTLDVGQIAYQVAVFGRLLTGLYIARSCDLEHPERHRPLLIRAVVIGRLVGLAGNTLFTWD